MLPIIISLNIKFWGFILLSVLLTGQFPTIQIVTFIFGKQNKAKSLVENPLIQIQDREVQNK
jgi:hypothetical protein